MIEPFRKLLGKQDAFEVRPEDPAGGVLGARPKLALRPRSAQEVAAVLQVAAERGLAVAPWGGGQHQDRGAVPASADIVLLTGQLAGITRFDAADQTLSAKAGTRLADIAQAARAERLWLPLDPPGLERATIGGVLAAGVSGPLRTGFGQPIDHVLGTLTAHSDGRLATSGGRLVKNVTGFDLHRLLHGSCGALAVICEVHLRLRPLPQCDASIAVTLGDAETLDRFLALVREAREAPVAYVVVDVESARSAQLPLDLGHKDGAYLVLLRYCDAEKAVERALSSIRTAAAAAQALLVQALDADVGVKTFERIREWPSRCALDGASKPVVAKLAALPMRAGKSTLGGLVEAGLAACAGTGAPCALLVEPALGLIRFVFAGEPTRLTFDALSALTRREPERMRFTIESGPAAIRAMFARHLGRTASFTLQRRLKRATDPAGILVPGRVEGDDVA
ncbi:MAG: FAD-binding oxidoreductase [Planctomycetes bacterium]|nr:FAD-binding oxidoreductase [Planctomycetota bacterium]